ncbi:MAG: CoA pyrophosphatase, partial [Anaerolineales bacterium]|nr:CoA pyrophosphatase [Anaerolineales bacterium]
MTEPDLPTSLSQRLERYEPETRAEWEAIPAAVLVPFYWEDEEWHLLFTRRTQTVNSHQGQVSFPGGAIEQDDGGSPETAALREAEEEVGLPKDQAVVLGQLDPLL